MDFRFLDYVKDVSTVSEELASGGYVDLDVSKLYGAVREGTLTIQGDGTLFVDIVLKGDKTIEDNMSKAPEMEKKFDDWCESGEHDGDEIELFIEEMGYESKYGMMSTYGDDPYYYWADENYSFIEFEDDSANYFTWIDGTFYEGSFREDAYYMMYMGVPEEEVAYLLGYDGDYERLEKDVQAMAFSGRIVDGINEAAESVTEFVMSEPSAAEFGKKITDIMMEFGITGDVLMDLIPEGEVSDEVISFISTYFVESGQTSLFGKKDKEASAYTYDWFLGQLVDTVNTISPDDFSGKLKYGLNLGIDYFRESADNEWGYVGGELFVNLDIERTADDSNSHAVVTWHGSEIAMGYGVKDLDGGELGLAIKGDWEGVKNGFFEWAAIFGNKSPESIIDIIESANLEYVWIERPEDSQYYKDSMFIQDGVKGREVEVAGRKMDEELQNKKAKEEITTMQDLSDMSDEELLKIIPAGSYVNRADEEVTEIRDGTHTVVFEWRDGQPVRIARVKEKEEQVTDKKGLYTEYDFSAFDLTDDQEYQLDSFISEVANLVLDRSADGFFTADDVSVAMDNEMDRAIRDYMSEDVVGIVNMYRFEILSLIVNYLEGYLTLHVKHSSENIKENLKKQAKQLEEYEGTRLSGNMLGFDIIRAESTWIEAKLFTVEVFEGEPSDMDRKIYGRVWEDLSELRLEGEIAGHQAVGTITANRVDVEDVLEKGDVTFAITLEFSGGDVYLTDEDEKDVVGFLGVLKGRTSRVTDDFEQMDSYKSYKVAVMDKRSVKGSWDSLEMELSRLFEAVQSDFFGAEEKEIYTGIEYLKEEADAPEGYIVGEIFLNLFIDNGGEDGVSHLEVTWDGDESELGGKGYYNLELGGSDIEMEEVGDWKWVQESYEWWYDQITALGKDGVLEEIKRLVGSDWIERPEDSQYYKGGSEGACEKKVADEDEGKTFGFALDVAVDVEEVVDWDKVNEEVELIERNVLDLMKNDDLLLMVRDEGHSDGAIVGTVIVEEPTLSEIEDMVDVDGVISTGMGNFWYDESQVFAGVASDIYYNVSLYFFE